MPHYATQSQTAPCKTNLRHVALSQTASRTWRFTHYLCLTYHQASQRDITSGRVTPPNSHFCFHPQRYPEELRVVVARDCLGAWSVKLSSRFVWLKLICQTAFRSYALYSLLFVCWFSLSVWLFLYLCHSFSLAVSTSNDYCSCFEFILLENHREKMEMEGEKELTTPSDFSFKTRFRSFSYP